MSAVVLQTVQAQDTLGPLDLEGRTITSITFNYRGVRTVNEQRLRDRMSVREGMKYATEAIDNDIASLYESGLVDDVSFLGDPHGANSLKLIVEVVTRGQFIEMGFVGNTIFSDRKLASEAKLKAGVISDKAILAARRNIETLYKGFGYPDVLVSHRLRDTDEAGQYQLILVIEEGVKSEVRKIRFEGNQAFSRVELRREMKTKQKGLLSFITKSGRIDAEKLQQDLRSLEDFYRNHGFRAVRIEGARREPVKDGRVDLIIPIDEGLKYTVQSVSYGNMTVFTPEELMPGLSLVGGDLYSGKKIRDDVRMIRSYYGSRGYADALVQVDMRDVSPGMVVIVFQITEGRRYRVGKVNIQGNTVTQDKVIRREVPMQPGEPYNSVDEDTTSRRLKNINYFDGVQVSGSPSTQAGYRDVNLLVNEKKTGSISFGAGFSSIDSIVGYLNLEQTNFDISNPKGFFRGAGQRFGMQLRIGNERRDFKVSLVEPWFLGKRLSLGTELYYRDLLYLSDEYDQGNVGGSVFIRRPLGRKGYVKAEYRFEQVSIDVDSVPPASLFLMEDGDFIKSAIALSYVFDSRDSNILPRRGHRASLGATMAGGILGGDVDTYTLSASGTKHWSLPWDIILNVNGSATVVDALSGTVPIFERQFIGGARSLRGFELRDVGPRDLATGSALGGNTAAFGSVEATFPIVENIRGAVFGDLGFVNAGSYEFTLDDLHSDAGLGLRLNLPFGPLALDYAVPLQSAKGADNGGQFNFYLNYQF
ncbi:MAG: outer membrane protein assembly factor BamA [Akkermansiaceae bacterium]